MLKELKQKYRKQRRLSSPKQDKEEREPSEVMSANPSVTQINVTALETQI